MPLIFSTLISLLLGCGALQAADVQGNRLAAQTSFDIPAQPLSTALKQLAHQAGIQILFEERVVRGYEAPAIKANQSAAQALSTLLWNTGLEFTASGDTVAIRRKTAVSTMHTSAMTEPVPTASRSDAAGEGGPLVAQAAASSAGAQSATADSAPTQENGDGLKLEEIIVTAQHREQNLQDVGMSVTALTGSELQKLGINSPQEIASQTPGLRFNLMAKDDVSLAFDLRGVGLDDTSAVNEAPVAVYLDQVYQATLAGNNGQLFDIERVEVLRGPQGTLYGRNTTGGIVHFISRRPTDSFESYLEATAGEYSLLRVEGALSGPLNSWLSGRLSGTTEDHDGYATARLPGVADAGTGGEYSTRLQLLARPSADAEILLNGYYTRADLIPAPYEHASTTYLPDGVTVVPLPEDQLNAVCPASGPGADCFGYQDRDDDPFAQDNNREKHSNLTKVGASATLDWRFDAFSLTAISAFQHVEKVYREDADAGPIDAVKVTDPIDSEQWSHEVRLAGGTESLRWTTGLYYFNRVADAGPKVDFTGIGFVLANATVHDDIESSALFGQVEYDFSSAWTGLIGLRYTQDRRDYSLLSIDESGLYPNPVIDFRRETVGDLATQKDDTVSGRVELDWRPSDGLLVYGAVSRGIKGAGFNQDPGIGGPGRDPNTIPVGNEVLLAYEVGLKSTFLDQRSQLNTAAFYYDYDGFQSFTFKDLVNSLTNQDATIQGLEAELELRPLRGLDLRLGVALLDTEVTGITRQNFFTGQSVTLETREMPRAPHTAVNGVIRYEWPSWNGFLSLQGDFSMTGDHYLSVENSPFSKEEAYTIVNARVTYRDRNDRYSIAAWVKNLTDEEYRVAADSITSVGYSLELYGQPRWAGVTVRFNF